MSLDDIKQGKTSNAVLKWTHFLSAVDSLKNKDEYRHYKLAALCDIANNNGAPRYYVSARSVLDIYCTWKKTKVLPVMSESLKRMYLEIFDKYEKLIAGKKMHGYTLEYMDMILAQPASSFFIDNTIKFYYRAYTYRRKLIRRRQCLRS